MPAQLLDAPFRGSEAVATGLLTKHQLRSNCWRRLLRGVYCHADVPDGPALRAAAVRLVLPKNGVVAGAHAAWLHGADVVRTLDPIEVYAVGMRARPGVLVRAWTLDAGDVVEVDGVPLTTPVRTAFDLVRRQSLIEGVVALDALTCARLVTGGQLIGYAAVRRGWRGVRRVPRVVDLHEPGAESPMESRARMVLVLGGLPRPEVQIQLHDEGGLLVARLDMGYRKARVGVEFDGRRYHAGVAGLADDRRDNGVAVCGYTVLRYVGSDVYRRPRLMLEQVAAALRLAGVEVGDLDPGAVSRHFDTAPTSRWVA